MRRQPAGALALTGLLGAVALALSFLEGLLPPLPLLPPGAKLGLSNLATMYAAGALGLPYALFLAVFKGCFALLTRGAVAGCMSLAGGLLSTLVMWLTFRKARASLAVVGVCGALSHNAAQLLVAYAHHLHPGDVLPSLSPGVRGAHRAAHRPGAQAHPAAPGCPGPPPGAGPPGPLTHCGNALGVVS